MKDDYLSIEQVKELLPAQLKIIRKYGNSRSLYLTKDEIIISLSNSKEFESDKWWYSVFIYDLAEKGVKEVCFVLGKKGIVVLPLTILLNYAEYADFNENYVQGKRFFIRIKKENNKLILFQSGNKDIDITSKFIPFHQ
jgi:hypothetical protein